MYDNVIIFYIKLFAFSKNRAILNTEKCSCKSMDVTVHTPLSREVFWHEYAKIPRHTSKNAITEGDFKCIFACNCEGTEQLLIIL